jgi:hypothetical protein
MNRKLNRLMQRYAGKVIYFKYLPMPHKLAIAWYMAIDGDAWRLPFDSYWADTDTNKLKRLFIKNVYKFDEQYGNKKFGVINIPVEVCKEEVMKHLQGDFKTFNDYHTWYVSHSREKHTRRNAWPCILSDFKGEFFQDGWHRFHRYIDLKMENIPCICYI